MFVLVGVGIERWRQACSGWNRSASLSLRIFRNAQGLENDIEMAENLLEGSMENWIKTLKNTRFSGDF